MGLCLCLLLILIGLKRSFRYDGEVMKRIDLILLSLILIGLASETWAVPPLPHIFYGTVKRNGTNVPDGTVISARIKGVQYATVMTTTFGGNSVYSIHVPGDDLGTSSTTEGGVNGDTVSFTVGSDTANQSAIFSSGSSADLPLTAPQTFTCTIHVSTDGLCNNYDPCFPNIQNGIALASAPCMIKITEETYNENILLDFDEMIILQGGWDVLFTSSSSYTTIRGSVTITRGTLIPEYIILE